MLISPVPLLSLLFSFSLNQLGSIFFGLQDDLADFLLCLDSLTLRGEVEGGGWRETEDRLEKR